MYDVMFKKKLVHQIDRFSLLTRIGRVDISVIGDKTDRQKGLEKHFSRTLTLIINTYQNFSN